MNQKSVFNIKLAIAIVALTLLFVGTQVFLGYITNEAHKEVMKNEELTSYTP